MIPEVRKCSVNQCYYNRNNECNAHSILVGSDEPICETFTQSGEHIRKSGQSEVGACHVAQCEYNQSLSCHACSDIEVSWDQDKAWCATYEPR
jgi:hypothetical protein